MEKGREKEKESLNKSSDTVFSIRVTLINNNGVDTKNQDLKISAANEDEAFYKLQSEVNKIHKGNWFYAGYFKKGE